MRKFYLLYKNVQSVTGQVSWTHYCELLSVSDDSARNFYEIEYINSNWSVRELKRQISTSLFERLLLFGQMNMYVNYYDVEVNDEGDNPPIGILLCTSKAMIVAEYALGGLSTNIFASTYVKYIPDKEQLIKQVEYVLNKKKVI